MGFQQDSVYWFDQNILVSTGALRWELLPPHRNISCLAHVRCYHQPPTIRYSAVIFSDNNVKEVRLAAYNALMMAHSKIVATHAKLSPQYSQVCVSHVLILHQSIALLGVSPNQFAFQTTETVSTMTITPTEKERHRRCHCSCCISRHGLPEYMSFVLCENQPSLVLYLMASCLSWCCSVVHVHARTQCL